MFLAISYKPENKIMIKNLSGTYKNSKVDTVWFLRGKQPSNVVDRGMLGKFGGSEIKDRKKNM